MYDEQYIIEKLNIGEWPDDEKKPVVIEATVRIGDSIIDSLTDEQFEEYKAIVDDNKEVINNWLNANIPDYKDNETFKAIEDGYNDDPEKNSPNKLFATIAWVQLNVPDLKTRIEDTLSRYKQELAA
jgi:hypothetical protein